jgi:dTDP-4-amino-4,6-dideoxygalactose transaminase
MCKRPAANSINSLLETLDQSIGRDYYQTQSDQSLSSPSRTMTRIPFNIPPVTGREIEYLSKVIERREFSGNGMFTAQCQSWLKQRLGVREAILTHSCTAALEMTAILAGLEPGDEVIMPSFTFVSTANAVVLRRAVPVFVDIRPDTLNIDENLIEAAITPRTKAICVVHYAGVCAEMDKIQQIAQTHGLIVIEDAAQALLSTYRDRPAGRLGELACFSFHETKNVTAGEGGALTINDPRFSERAYVIWEKGTNRRALKLGLVDKYSWIDQGSSFLPSEFVAAVLLAQLEEIERLTDDRRATWDRYHASFADLEAAGLVRRPIVPAHCIHNGHLYYLLVRDQSARDLLIQSLRAEEIWAPFHYVPLHSSLAGQRYARSSGEMPVTNKTSARLIRLPLYATMDPSLTDQVIDRVGICLRT